MYEKLAVQTGADCKVASVMLEFNNYKVISMLQQKANLLKMGREDEAKQVSSQIDQVL